MSDDDFNRYAVLGAELDRLLKILKTGIDKDREWAQHRIKVINVELIDALEECREQLEALNGLKK
jgi:hypothetical protein